MILTHTRLSLATALLPITLFRIKKTRSRLTALMCQLWESQSSRSIPMRTFSCSLRESSSTCRGSLRISKFLLLASYLMESLLLCLPGTKEQKFMVTKQSYRALTFMWNTKYQILLFAMSTILRDNAMVSRWPRIVSLQTIRWALFKQSNSTRLVTLSIWFMLLEAYRPSTTQTQRSKTWS